jgi:hypothetical protein
MFYASHDIHGWHGKAYPFWTHRLHSHIQTSVDLHHVASDLSHGNSSLYATSDCIDAGREL